MKENNEKYEEGEMKVERGNEEEEEEEKVMEVERQWQEWGKE